MERPGRHADPPLIDEMRDSAGAVGYVTLTLPVKKNGATVPKQKTLTLDPDAKPPIFPTPALNPKFESSAKQFQLSPPVPQC